MTRMAFDKIMDGLTDALAYAEGDKNRGKAHEVEAPRAGRPRRRRRSEISILPWTASATWRRDDG